MKEIILYGAGIRGRQVADLLRRKGIRINGFCDSNQTEGELETGETQYLIYPVEHVIKNTERYRVIVTIANHKDIKEIEEKLRQSGVTVTTVEEILDAQEIDLVSRNRRYIADFHMDEMDAYYENGEAEANLRVFWGEGSEFKKMFSCLDLSDVVELACGHGRHVPQYALQAGRITLVDVLDRNIVYCQNRFGEYTHIRYEVNNGYDLQALPSDSQSALFTYDAMVHFEMMDIFEYLKETRRILKPGGLALFHHSNNTEDYRITFSTGTCGRNYMSAQIFAYLANRAGLRVMEQKIIDWAGNKNLDCLTLVAKDCL